LFTIDQIQSRIFEEDAMKRLVLSLAILCVSATLVSAQSLVDVAKKEKERRKKVDAQGKQAFTENDLRGGPRSRGAGLEPRCPANPGPRHARRRKRRRAKPDPMKTVHCW
jgi:hypothetical protein